MNKSKENLVKNPAELAEITNTIKGSGARHNEGKMRHDLFQSDSLNDMSRVLNMGAKKYDPHNWQNGMNWSTVVQSMKRHLKAFESGEDYDYDPECLGCRMNSCESHSGLLHMSHIQTNAHFLNAYYYLYPQGDDRRKKFLFIPKVGLDIDEVLADWLGAWMKRFDITDVPTSWFFDRDIKKRMEELRSTNELDELYSNLKPRLLPEDIPFVPHCYVTSRPIESSVTMKWLDKHGFPARPVYTVPPNTSKYDVLQEAGVEVFIDDSWDNFVDINNRGSQEKQNKITCYLYDTPHNRVADVGHLRIKKLSDLPFLK